jgi:putative CocE/NonD family hydrolase
MKFKYYEHGVHCGDFTLDDKGVSGRRLDRFTGRWSDESPLAPDADSQGDEFPFEEVLPAFKAFSLSRRDSRAEEAVLPDGRVYQRYRTARDKTGKKSVTIWALVSEGPMLDLAIDDEMGTLRAVFRTTRHGTDVLAEDGWEGTTPVAMWDDVLIPAPCGIRHRGTEYAETRDGVRLATEVWLPDDGENGKKYPTVLIRTPYGRMINGKRMAYLAERGYALVSQDVRGRDDSEGEFTPSANEISDAEDMLNWLVAQPWCDGSIGMIGASYLGRVQWQAAAAGHPALKALVSQVTAGGPFVDTPMPGGAFQSGFFAWMFMMSERSAAKEKMIRSDWPRLLASRPLRDIPEKALGKKLPFWEKWIEHPNYDEFWSSGDWAAYGDRINVPALLISGWYDDDGMGTVQAWKMNSSRGRKNQRMILGPWFHNYNSTRSIHGVRFGPNALRYDLDIVALRWFEKFLKGVDNGVESLPAVEYYMVGVNEWMEASSWPPEDSKPTPLYLHSGGRANGASGDGTLSFEAPGGEPADEYDYDPNDPAPQLIEMSENEMAVPENYREVEAREDILVYTSEPLDAPLSIAGDVIAVLHAASDAPDTDWIVRLTDVDSNGDSIRLADRVLRARYRDSWSDPKLLTPGETVRYEISLPHIANTFLKGHRIRVHVTSSAANLTFPNPNTGGDIFAETGTKVARQKVCHSSGVASRVILPICPQPARIPAEPER